MYRQGSQATSLDEIMARSRTSKSQLYHYFANKEALLYAVIEVQTVNVMQAQSPYLERLDSLPALRRWCKAIIALTQKQSGLGGCPLGSLASELAEHSDAARGLLKRSFELWEAHLAAGLNTMRSRGELSSKSSPSDLATATLCALQGGLLLAQIYRNARPVQVALDMAVAQIATHVIKKSHVKRGSPQVRLT
jgi:TetR/AcrR family transcriptional repressor of nem operon